jgi:hypothetical protein
LINFNEFLLILLILQVKIYENIKINYFKKLKSTDIKILKKQKTKNKKMNLLTILKKMIFFVASLRNFLIKKIKSINAN